MVSSDLLGAAGSSTAVLLWSAGGWLAVTAAIMVFAIAGAGTAPPRGRPHVQSCRSVRGATSGVPNALALGRAALRTERANVAWVGGYNGLALPIAAGAFAPFGLVLRPTIAALSMSGPSILVVPNTLLLKRLRLPNAPAARAAESATARQPEPLTR